MKYRVRAADLFVTGGQKIGTLTQCTVSIKGQGERMTTSGGTIKTKGRPVTDIDFEGVVPVDGMPFDAFQATIDQADLTVISQFNGKIYAVEGTFDEATMESVQQSGKTTGKFKFTGAEPQVVG